MVIDPWMDFADSVEECASSFLQSLTQLDSAVDGWIFPVFLLVVAYLWLQFAAACEDEASASARARDRVASTRSVVEQSQKRGQGGSNRPKPDPEEEAAMMRLMGLAPRVRPTWLGHFDFSDPLNPQPDYGRRIGEYSDRMKRVMREEARREELRKIAEGSHHEEQSSHDHPTANGETSRDIQPKVERQQPELAQGKDSLDQGYLTTEASSTTAGLSNDSDIPNPTAEPKNLRGSDKKKFSPLRKRGKALPRYLMRQPKQILGKRPAILMQRPCLVNEPRKRPLISKEKPEDLENESSSHFMGFDVQQQQSQQPQQLEQLEQCQQQPQQFEQFRQLEQPQQLEQSQQQPQQFPQVEQCQQQPQQFQPQPYQPSQFQQQPSQLEQCQQQPQQFQQQPYQPEQFRQPEKPQQYEQFQQQPQQFPQFEQYQQQPQQFQQQPQQFPQFEQCQQHPQQFPQFEQYQQQPQQFQQQPQQFPQLEQCQQQPYQLGQPQQFQQFQQPEPNLPLPSTTWSDNQSSDETMRVNGQDIAMEGTPEAGGRVVEEAEKEIISTLAALKNAVALGGSGDTDMDMIGGSSNEDANGAQRVKESYDKGYDEGYKKCASEARDKALSQRESYDDGYKLGYDLGHEIGTKEASKKSRNQLEYYNEGYKDGYDKGHKSRDGLLSQKDSYDEGYREGYDKGYEICANNDRDVVRRVERSYDDGYDKGLDDGHKRGYEKGYDDGYEEGVNESSDDESSNKGDNEMDEAPDEEPEEQSSLSKAANKGLPPWAVQALAKKGSDNLSLTKPVSNSTIRFAMPVPASKSSPVPLATGSGTTAGSTQPSGGRRVNPVIPFNMY